MRATAAALVVALGLLVAACGDAFDPFTDETNEYFGVFGYLESGADTQFVRVEPVRQMVDAPMVPSGVKVTTTAQDTGEQIAWQDSIVTLDDGSEGLLFYAPFEAVPGRTYHLDVQRDDGVTSADVRVPDRVRADTAAVRFAGPEGLVQPVTLPGLTPPFDVRARYVVTPPGASDSVVVVLPLHMAPAREGSDVTVQLNLSQDRFDVLQRLDVPFRDSTVVLHSVGLEIERLSPEWLTREAAPDNIDHGFGFFGAIGRYVESWTLDPGLVNRLGYGLPAPN